jgi:hypothetical protein
MDGIIANLRRFATSRSRFDALVMVDDSHAVGLVGERGRGAPDLDVEVCRHLTGTLDRRWAAPAAAMSQPVRWWSCCGSARAHLFSMRWRHRTASLEC